MIRSVTFSSCFYVCLFVCLFVCLHIQGRTWGGGGFSSARDPLFASLFLKQTTYNIPCRKRHYDICLTQY